MPKRAKSISARRSSTGTFSRRSPNGRGASEVRRAYRSFHDRPFVFDNFSTDAEEPIIQIHRRITMRNDESQFLARPDVAPGIFQRETPVFVARELILNPADLQWLGSERPIRGECLQSGIDDGLSAR